jgi:hypothetical protein
MTEERQKDKVTNQMDAVKAPPFELLQKVAEYVNTLPKMRSKSMDTTYKGKYRNRIFSDIDMRVARLLVAVQSMERKYPQGENDPFFCGYRSQFYSSMPNKVYYLMFSAKPCLFTKVQRNHPLKIQTPEFFEGRLAMLNDIIEAFDSRVKRFELVLPELQD